MFQSTVFPAELLVM
jgi:hypothetical protein